MYQSFPQRMGVRPFSVADNPLEMKKKVKSKFTFFML
jgi:hypothetical protein